MSDDVGEVKEVPTQNLYEKKYNATWNYWKNTDGGIIGPFIPGSTIKIDMVKTNDIRSVNFASSSSRNEFSVPIRSLRTGVAASNSYGGYQLYDNTGPVSIYHKSAVNCF